MGELVTQGLKHAHDIVVDMLTQVGATDVYAMTDLEEVVSANRLDPLTRKHETWYIAKSGSPRHKGVPYIGVILLSPSIEESDELKRTGGSIFSSTAGSEFPVTDPCVQVWGRKVMAAASGVDYYNCPLEFLDETEPTSDVERRWRDEVRRRAEARGS